MVAVNVLGCSYQVWPADSTSASERGGRPESRRRSSVMPASSPAAIAVWVLTQAPTCQSGARSTYRPQPLVPPAVRPATRCFWAKKKTRPAGMVISTAAAVRLSHCGLNCGTNCCSPAPRVSLSSVWMNAIA